MTIVSVVLATYNGARFIRQQLDSIRRQSRPPDEVVIIDDCSTDGTPAAVEEFIRSHRQVGWHLTRSAENVGYRRNFYRGVRASRGDVVFLCDQDDIWNRDKVKLMTEVMAATPGVLSLNSAVRLIDERGNPLRRRSPFGVGTAKATSKALRSGVAIERIEAGRLMVRNVGPGAAQCFDGTTRERFLESYDCGMPHDWYLNLLAAVREGCWYLDEPLVNYRVHGANAIGARSSWRRAFDTRARESLAAECRERLLSFSTIPELVERSHNRMLGPAWSYTRRRQGFYADPSVRSWLELTRRPEYRAATSPRARLWDAIIASGADTFLERIAAPRPEAERRRTEKP